MICFNGYANIPNPVKFFADFKSWEDEIALLSEVAKNDNSITGANSTDKKINSIVFSNIKGFKDALKTVLKHTDGKMTLGESDIKDVNSIKILSLKETSVLPNDYRDIFNAVRGIFPTREAELSTFIWDLEVEFLSCHFDNTDDKTTTSAETAQVTVESETETAATVTTEAEDTATTEAETTVTAEVEAETEAEPEDKASESSMQETVATDEVKIEKCSQEELDAFFDSLF